MNNDASGFTVAVFPYLKTSGPLKIGPYSFRSTDDLSELSQAESTAVTEIAQMLFIQNHARVLSASYAIIPRTDVDGLYEIPESIRRVQTLVAYLYGAPHEIFGNTFLNFESATLLLLTPDRVSRFLVEAQHHIVQEMPPIQVDWKDDSATGYAGLMNFSQPFWVVKGSRIYPPVPQITLNISQDLAQDLDEFSSHPGKYELFGLLRQDDLHVAERVFTSLNWYNAANRAGASEGEALISLAIAFEALLQLPQGEKTDRFVDTVSLLLGRVPRLDEWVRQFYDARSRVAHEGKLSQGRFLISRGAKPPQTLIYHPLLVFGRQVFRLCVGGIAHGAYLAKSGDLAAKLTTNTERFEELCKLFDSGPLTDPARKEKVRQILSEIGRYRFVSETGLSADLIVGAAQRSANSLLGSNVALKVLDSGQLSRFIQTNMSKDELGALEGLYAVHSNLNKTRPGELDESERFVCELMDIAWMYTFQRYFRLKKMQERSSSPPG
jgi:hypothetical protein